MGLNKNITQPDSDAATSEMAYFLDVLSQFISTINTTTETSENELMLVARSAESCISKAVFHHRDELKEAGVHLNVIFSQVHLSDELSNWLMPDISPLGQTPETQLRWTNKTSLADAHEQLTLKDTCSWSGESMRRDVNARFGFYLFHEDCPKTARLGGASFRALWNISKPLPQSLLKRRSSAVSPELLNFQTENFEHGMNDHLFITPELTRH